MYCMMPVVPQTFTDFLERLWRNLPQLERILVSFPFPSIQSYLRTSTDPRVRMYMR